jgi:hypothetical protein
MQRLIPKLAELRVKIKSLAEESRIIRHEERKARNREVHESLYRHRVVDVRREQRASVLAYAFLRGRDYASCERPAGCNPPDFARIQRLVEKFGSRDWRSLCSCKSSVLKGWVAGTLEIHPFAREVESVAVV